MPAKRKEKKDRQKDRSYDFVFILYPETPEAKLLLLQLQSYHYDAVGIKHDRDVYPKDVIDEETGEVKHHEGELKKEHYHFYIRFNNARFISGVADELSIPEHLIQFAEDFRAFGEYILHWGKFGGSGKFVYETDDLIGSLAGSLKSNLVHEPAELQENKIYRFIKQYDGKINYSIVYEYAYRNGYGRLCVSRIAAVKTWIDDHNDRFYNSKSAVYQRK